jgi:PKD repeat protein
VTVNVAGGNAGRNQSTVSFQNAAKGGNGISSANNTTVIPVSDDLVQRKMEIITQPIAQLACVGDTTTLLLAAQGTNLVYEWQINKSTGYEKISNDDTYGGVSSPTLQIKNVSETLNPYLYRCVVKSNCATNTVLTTNEISLNIKTPPIPIFTHAITNNTVSFNNGSSGGLSFNWTFGDGESDTLANPVHTYALQDTYRVILKVNNQCGITSYDALINLNTPPLAGFTANGRDACPPSSIFFTNISSDNVRKYYWSFPGGTPDTSNAKDPAVTYSLPGIYDVRLIVENGYGRDTFIREQYVKINDKPLVNFTASKNGLNVNFINNTTNATSFLWNFGDSKTSTQVSPQYTYQNAGTYIVRLKASNVCGNVQDSVKLVIFSLPAATISASQTQGCAPMVVQYAGRNTTNVTSWNWSFPGGTPATSNQANPRVTYFQPGKYDIILTITNSAGTNTLKQDTSIWVSESPKASFNYKITADVVEV